MKLITLNAWQGRIFRNLKPYFVSHPADIICLQEVTSSPQALGPWDLFQALETIHQSSALKTNYFSPTYGFMFMGTPVKFGNAMLTNYPIASEQTFFTADKYRDITSAEDYIPGSRNAQIIRLSTPFGKLTVVNFHGRREVDKMGNKTTSMEQIKLLAAELKHIRGPLIVAGDFNLSSHSEAIQYFKHDLGLRDLTLDYGIENTLTSSVIPVSADCDHIFVSSEVRVKNFSVEETVLSDHKALIVEFEI